MTTMPEKMAAAAWCEWEARSGMVTLPDGEKVLVQPGDRVLLRELPCGSFAVLDHEGRVIQ